MREIQMHTGGHMEHFRYQISFIIPTLLFLSCNDLSLYYYPGEVGIGTGRGISQRHEIIMDSTIAGVPTVVGSEWVYSDSDSFTTDTLRVGISRLRLASVFHDSSYSILLFQEFIGTKTDTFYADIVKNRLEISGGFLGGIWGGSLPYEFPLTVGKRWNYGLYISSLVAGKEKITVKAGTFDAYDIRSFDDNIPCQTWDRWYAPGIGIVCVTDTDGCFVYHRELLSFHIGPRRR
jgi:hypothetical protein